MKIVDLNKRKKIKEFNLYIEIETYFEELVQLNIKIVCDFLKEANDLSDFYERLYLASNNLLAECLNHSEFNKELIINMIKFGQLKGCIELLKEELLDRSEIQEIYSLLI